MTGEVVFRHAEPVMGTVVSFDVRPHGLSAAHTRAAIDAACGVLHRADEVFSLYRADSPLSRLRAGQLDLADCPPEVARVLELCERAWELSEGWFDPWALPGGVDPTGMVKGWAAREAAAVLHEAGIDAAMVSAAGDLTVFGTPAGRPWRVGIRAPEAPDRLLCVVEADGAVATSGHYERGAHVIDVRRGGYATAAVSATVCGPDLARADALATGLLAAGEEGLEAIERAGYQALVVDPGGHQARTPGFPVVGEPVGVARD